MMTERFWHAFFCSLNEDLFKVESMSSTSNIVIKVPQYETEASSGKKKRYPIYTNYGFIQGTNQECQYFEQLVKESISSFKILKDEKGFYFIVTDDEMNVVLDVEKNFLQDYSPSLIETFVPGVKVNLCSGPLVNCDGYIMDVKYDMVQVNVSIFNRDLPIWVNKTNCKVVE